MKLTLSNPAMLEINGGAYIGGSQEWYPERWQRMSGCGPTAAANLIWYLARSRPELQALCEVGTAGRDSFIRLMTEMFSYITPGMGGVNNYSVFTRGLLRYCEAHNANMNANCLEVASKPRSGPPLSLVCDYLTSALQSDLPAAFLNLTNGALANLESWHWVTIVALETDNMLATVSDQGRTIDINLASWLETSMLGGAMVTLYPGQA